MFTGIELVMDRLSPLGVAIGDHALGMCHSLVSDRDTLMTSEFWQALFKRLGTTLSMSAARSQQTNGTVERIIAVVEENFRTRIDQRQATGGVARG